MIYYFLQASINRSNSGGVRGILELLLLESLVRRVGFDIPIQELFDVVIGTSTGMSTLKSEAYCINIYITRRRHHCSWPF